MRPTPNPLVETYRQESAGRLSSTTEDGNNGAFMIPVKSGKVWLQVIVSDGLGWDHVSAVPVDRNHRKLYRTPSWEEMCLLKRLFFSDDETVVQYHPPRSIYRNAHDYCLHLWRPQTGDIPLPDPIMVAPAPQGVRNGV
jgi:hypothetical protein